MSEPRMCETCKREFPLQSDFFPKKGDGEYGTECKMCHKLRQSTWSKEKNRAYQRARARALRQLSKLFVTEYRNLLDWEMEQEGLRESQAQA